MLKACKKWFPSLKWVQNKGEVTAATKRPDGTVTGVWRMTKVDHQYPYRLEVEGVRNLFSQGETPEDACRLMIERLKRPDDDAQGAEALVPAEIDINPLDPPPAAVDGLMGHAILSIRQSMMAMYHHFEHGGLDTRATTLTTVKLAREEVERVIESLRLGEQALDMRHSLALQAFKVAYESLEPLDDDALRAVESEDDVAEVIGTVGELVKVVHTVLSHESTDFQRHEAVKRLH